jgi:hypothetical protein
MKKVLRILLFMVAVLIFTTDYNLSLNRVISHLSGAEFKIPAQLKFRIYLFGFLPVGKAALNLGKSETYQGKEVYHLQAQATTLGWLSPIFKASLSMDSWIDKKERYPLLFKQILAISNKEDQQNEIIYEQKNGVMISEGVKRQILPGTHDPLSLIFYIMQMNLENIKDLQMNINTNQKNYILKADLQYQTVSISRKIYNTVLLEAGIKRRDKNPYHQTQAKMVLLKEKGNLPLLIKVFAGGISVNAKLIDIK